MVVRSLGRGVGGAWLLAGAVAACSASEPAPGAAEADDAGAPPLYASDLGDGTYRNPVLPSDYSDPDVLRVGDEYWLVASSFTSTPALPLLRSRDLVNWTLAGHALANVPGARFAEPQDGQGVWAPSIREHAGTFYVFFPVYCRPADGGACDEEGVWVVAAPSPAGPWGEPRQLLAGRGLIDPCPFWDDDGKAYLAHAYAASRAGFGSRLDVRPMSPDATQMLGEGQQVFSDPTTQPTIEGPKVHKRNGWYYLLAPAGGVQAGWQVALRSRSIYGPYEARVVLEQGTTSINGPHQGALVDTPSGDEWWFVHFQDQGVYGRVLRLEPAEWQDDWPLLGVAGAGGVREPVAAHRKPATAPQPVAVPASSDEFDGPTLGPQWQWQANHDDAWASLGARPGALRLTPRSAPGGDLARAPSLLLQKLPARAFTAETLVEPSGTAGSSVAGLVVTGRQPAAVAVREAGGAVEVSLVVGGKTVETASLPAGAVRLRVSFADGGACRFSYGSASEGLRAFATPFTAEKSAWTSAKVGVFAVAADRSDAPGWADFDSFRFAPYAD